MSLRTSNRFSQQSYRQARQVFKERQDQPRPGNYRIREYQPSSKVQPRSSRPGNYRIQGQANYKATRPVRKQAVPSFNQRDYRKDQEVWSKRKRQPQTSNTYQKNSYRNRFSQVNRYQSRPTSTSGESWYHRIQRNLLRNKDSQGMGSRPPLPANRIQLLAVFSVLFLIYLVTGWQLMPMHRLNYITVSGNHYINGQTILDSSRLNSLDNYRAVQKQADQIEAKIKEEIPMIESVVMKRNSWKNLDLKVTEYEMVAITEINGKLLPVLSNGQPLMAEADLKVLNQIKENLPKIVNFDQKGKVIDLCNNGLRNLSPDLLAKIESIHLSDDPAKPDRITVKMKDGNYVVAVINTFAQKMRHYPQILDQLAGRVGTINLEVANYFSPGKPTNSINLESN